MIPLLMITANNPNVNPPAKIESPNSNLFTNNDIPKAQTQWMELQQDYLSFANNFFRPAIFYIFTHVNAANTPTGKQISYSPKPNRVFQQ
jgi:hypothetical protein